MIKAVVDRFENGYAILSLKDGQILNWPVNHLPPEIHEGDVVWLSLSKDQKRTADQKQLAKAILNELLNED